MENKYQIQHLNKKLKSPKIIGIIFLILAIMQFLGYAIILGVQLFDTYGDYLLLIHELGFNLPYYFTFMGFLGSFGLLYISILLIRYKDKGRRLFNIYLFYLIILTPLFYWFHVYDHLTRKYTNDFELSQMLAISLISTILSLLVFGVFWYILNKKCTKNKNQRGQTQCR